MARSTPRKAARRKGKRAALVDPIDLVEKVEQTRDVLRTEARERIGVTGRDEKPAPLRDVIRERGASLYPLGALGLLSIVDSFQLVAFGVLIPEISAALGISKAAIAGVIAVRTLANALGPLPIAALTQQKARRALIIVVTGFLWSIVAISTGFVTAVAGLLAVLIFDGITTASVGALHLPFLLDSYPPEGRVRALSYWEGISSVGRVLSPLLVALLAGVIGLTWRGVFVALGLLSLLATCTTVRLRDPGFGRWDTEQIRATVRKREGARDAEPTEGLSESDVALGFFEIVRRLLLIPTIRRLLIAQAVFGVLLIPFQAFLAFFLDERWNLGPTGRGIFSAYQWTMAIIGLSLYGRRAEALFRIGPRRVVELAATLLFVGIGLVCVAAVAPFFGVMIAAFGLAWAVLVLLGPGLQVAFLSVIPAGMRPHAAALLGIFLGFGGLAGSLFLGGIDRRFGIVGTIVAMLAPGLIGALFLRSAGKLVAADLDRMIDDTIEDEEIREITSSGGHLPMLRCHKVNFAYGQIQVLFDVDFTVDDGEMVALLGTNGAGKSTLLKVISGIGLPFGGSVRYRGAEITYLDAERRLRLGITQVPGGRAVFGPMSVIENLRVFGYSIGRKRNEVNAGIERALEVFPRLNDRRNQKAITLSGGEQQMLGVAKALMLRPRLLLVDELSLGLAPVVVGQLLEIIREINRDGTAVVLVEQSVNIALNLVDHAYFMEKGEMRFDGKSSDLLKRSDLLRAVFLGGRADGNKKRGGPRSGGSRSAK